MNRYYVQKEEAFTECECPEHLCSHEDGIMPYAFWCVIDREDDDRQPIDFDRYADARRACDRLNRSTCAVCGKPIGQATSGDGRSVWIHAQPYDPFTPPIHAARPA